jgi:DNA-binding NarL/FixJ family response regulator
MKSDSRMPPSLPTITPKRIFVVEDHPVFRRGLTHLIESDPALSVCGYASSFPNALDELRYARADAAIIDISIEGANGLELIKRLRADHPRMGLLVLSVHDELIYGPRALRAGAQGYVMKRESDHVLLQALHKVLAGEVFVSPALGRDLLYRTEFHGGSAGESPIACLTDRELEVLQLIGKGLASRQITEKLHIRLKTVESHRLHLKKKLGLSHPSELVHFALQWMGEQKGG